MKKSNSKSFAAYLMSASVFLVAGSVLLIAGILYFYFDKRLESEFNKKVLAQKGQVELIIEERITQIKNNLKNLCHNNSIRVTMMLNVKAELEAHLESLYPSINGEHYFIRNQSGEIAQATSGPDSILNDTINLIKTLPVSGRVVEEDETVRLIWIFEHPVMKANTHMGKAFVFYDMMADENIKGKLNLTMDGNLVISTLKAFHSLTEDKPLHKKVNINLDIKENPDLISIEPDIVMLRLDPANALYYLSSKTSLLAEKRQIAILICGFTILVLIFSVTLSIFFGRQMVRPLRYMASKALLISKGEKDLLFKNESHYLELDHLTDAFNYMLINLKSAEEKARFSELLANVDDAVYIIDHKGDIIEANDATFIQLGYGIHSNPKTNLKDIIPEKDLSKFLNQLDIKNSSHTPKKKTIQTFHLSSNGKALPVEINTRAIGYRGKNVILNVARDLSERKNAETALRESEERYRSVVENSHDGILIIGKKGKILYANNELCRISGYVKNEIINQNYIDYLSEESVSYLTELNLNDEKNISNPSSTQIEIQRKDGDLRKCKVSVSNIMDSKGETKSIVQIFDITDKLRIDKENKILEAQLFHAQKMKAIGTLAGGIAHDFNNLLMAIQGNISLMQLKTDKHHPHYKYIQGINRTVKNAGTLTKQILGFARGGKYEVKTTNLNDLVEKNSQMFARTQKGIKVTYSLPVDTWVANVDPGQIEQVMINLLLNSSQAMPDGGHLHIITKNIILDEKECIPLKLKSGKYILISVADTGTGIDEDVIDRIFEPFFTTKAKGIGTGLGLASAYGILRNHNGMIKAFSKKNDGTIFHIYLPATDKKIQEEKECTISLSEKNESILIIDAEEDIIRVSSQMANELGYKVLLAQNGEEAISIYKEKSKKPDMVILDMTMPEMSGKKTFRLLQEIDPEVKALLSSGYGMNPKVMELLDLGCKGFIQKPFDLIQLSQKIREILTDCKVENRL